MNVMTKNSFERLWILPMTASSGSWYFVHIDYRSQYDRPSLKLSDLKVGRLECAR